MRTLGSFNNRVRLLGHRDDYSPIKPDSRAAKTLATGGYTLGIARNVAPYEQPNPTGSEKFAKGQPRRMAGQALNMQVTRGTGLSTVSAAPMMGSAETRTPNIPQ